MKKKTLFIVVIIALFVAGGLLYITGKPSGEGAGATQSEVNGSILYDEENATEGVSFTPEKVEVIRIPEATTIENGDKEAFYANEEFADIIPADAASFSAKDIPSSYDSRDVDGKSYVTSVKNQGFTALCWAYVTLGAVETDILKHNSKLSASDIDLSEKHLSYYNMHSSEGSLGANIDADYREFVNAENEEGAWLFDYGTNYLDAGGVTNYSISVLSAWKGPVTDKGNDSLRNINRKEVVFKDNGDKPSIAYESEYHVQDVIEMKVDSGNLDLIKQMIMEHGSVAVGICADDKFWGPQFKTIYSHYEGKDITIADHEVLIVGWDDDFPASEFSYAPPGNGAWLCRNSWGEKKGYDGYFYLSYYDETIGTNNVAAYSVACKDSDRWYDNNYQAAGFISYVESGMYDDENYVTAFSPSVNLYGMLYLADKDELLKAIGLFSMETYQQYEFFIYLNPEKTEMSIDQEGKETTDKAGYRIDFERLKSPEKTFKASAIGGGYHTFELPEEITLNKGDEFLILVKPRTEGRLAFESEIDSVSAPSYDEWDYLMGNVHNHYEASGCSYYIADDGTALVSQQDKDFFVKAYTNNR